MLRALVHEELNRTRIAEKKIASELNVPERASLKTLHLQFIRVQKIVNNRGETVPYSLFPTLAKRLFQQALR
ncbi:MAG: hypothetical protein QNJ63_20415 [Calothrix sp. MO_192.B10]|nr:hypothetical protein [Calothrix sp. MO_192.B10]